MSEGYRAIAKDISISAQKVRLVVDMVRGKDVQEALAMLQFVQNRAAEPVYKIVRSAMVNAEENHGIDRSGLFIEKIFADEGRTLKRGRPGARGRYKPWLRRSSHITVILNERE